MESRSDKQLVQQILDGDREAFTFLVERYGKQIYSLTYRLTNDPQEAQDLGQEAFVRIYQMLDRYDPGRPFFSWMYKVAVNQCYSVLRRRREEHTPLEEVEHLVSDREGPGQPEQYVQTRENQRTVQEALARLPEPYRMPLVLRYLEEMSYREISQALEISESAVESRIHRGKKMIAKILGRK